MSDYIKREDAIEEFEHRESYSATYIRGFLKHLPSADVAPIRRGRWKFDRSGRGVNCSRCDMWMPFTMLPYCPYCGAKMDEEVEE